MQDFLLLASAVSMFGFGWFLVKRLDGFLENNCQARDGEAESDGYALQLDFSNPSATDNVSMAGLARRFLLQSIGRTNWLH